jgi:hypothetical protein
MTFPLQWSIKQHSALMWIGAGTSLIDTRTGVARHLGTARQQMGDAVLSRTGQLAAALQVCGKAGCAGRIVLVDPVTLRATHDLGRGELPAWSADGQSLYFVRRTLTSVLRFKDASGNPTPSNVYRTSIWRAGADASGLTRLVDEDAYGFGFLNVSSDGGTLVFSRVDNATQLWQHRLTNDAFNSTLLKRYGPQVTVQRYSGDGSPTTLFRDGGLPSVQP